ncbi:DUF4145 domain-containing protein [Corynebacterium camporealensis]
MSSEFWNNLEVINSSYMNSFKREQAYIDVPCGHCSATPTIKIAELNKLDAAARERRSTAVYCPHCSLPSIYWKDGQITGKAPQGTPDLEPEGTPPRIGEAWIEGERCFHAKAFNAAALMYRKIVFLVAVERGIQPKNKSGFAPNFQQCITYLLEQDYLTERQRTIWAESIRRIGNDATHEIESISQEQAEGSKKFTRLLLENVYEHESVANRILASEN